MDSNRKAARTFRSGFFISLIFLKVSQERLYHSEHQICHRESHYYVESLGEQEDLQRLPVLFPENFLETRLEPYADKGNAE